MGACANVADRGHLVPAALREFIMRHRRASPDPHAFER